MICKGELAQNVESWNKLDSFVNRIKNRRKSYIRQTVHNTKLRTIYIRFIVEINKHYRAIKENYTTDVNQRTFGIHDHLRPSRGLMRPELRLDFYINNNDTI